MIELWQTYLEPLGGTFALILTLIWALGRRFYWFPRAHAIRSYDEPPREVLKDYLQKFATSSNGIYHLYGTMNHFMTRVGTSEHSHHDSAIIGYKNINHTSLMLTDPLCAPEHRGEAITHFAKFCEHQKHDAFLLAIDQTTADEAKKQGYKLLKIGQEPIFDLATYNVDALPTKLKSSIRQVAKKGVVIEEIPLSKMFTPALASPLNDLLGKWFMTRGSDAFRLLTEVAPVKAADEKKFFVARSNDTIEGLLVCSKIFGRHGYFLHDLIRAPFSVNGVTDALVVHALKSLKEEGYAIASLGVSPLAGINPAKDSDFPRVTRLLKWTFENVRSTYRFKELYHFKKKFLPSHEEASYLAIPKSGLKLRNIHAILGMFSDLNLWRQASFVLRKWRLGYNVPKPLAKFLNPDKILLPPMASFDRETVFTRLKFTLGMLFLNIYTFIYTTDLQGQIDQDILEQHGFSFQNFSEHSWSILVTSNFVHFNYAHLIINMMGLVLFCGALEIVGGSCLTAIVYIFGLQSNLPTGLVLLPLLHWISPSQFNDTLEYVDVGASLGIMCGFGGLAYLMKPDIRRVLIAASCLAFVVYALVTKELIGVDHAFAIICGALFTKAYFRFQPSQQTFDSAEIRYFDRRAKRSDYTTDNSQEGKQAA